MPNATYWTTEKEIEYIKIIGETYFTGLSKIQLLRNYLSSMHKRDRWEGIDEVAISLFVRKQINKEMNKLTKHR